MEERRPKIGVGVLIRRRGELLLQRRIGAHGAGTWSLPGGHLEWNETFEACAAREVLEEVGLEVRSARFVGVTNDRMREDDRHYLTVFMEAEWSGVPAILEPEKTVELAWFAVDRLPEPLFEPLRALMAGEAYGGGLVYNAFRVEGWPSG